MHFHILWCFSTVNNQRAKTLQPYKIFLEWNNRCRSCDWQKYIQFTPRRAQHSKLIQCQREVHAICFLCPACRKRQLSGRSLNASDQPCPSHWRGSWYRTGELVKKYSLEVELWNPVTCVFCDCLQRTKHRT